MKRIGIPEFDKELSKITVPELIAAFTICLRDLKEAKEKIKELEKEIKRLRSVKCT